MKKKQSICKTPGGNEVDHYSIIIKTGEGHIISGILGGLRIERSQGNPKSSNSFLFIFYSLSSRAL